MAWQLTQMLWVGGLWLLYIGLVPALGRVGLAPLLIDEIAGMLNALMVGFATACVIFQLWCWYRPRALPVYGAIFAGNC